MTSAEYAEKRAQEMLHDFAVMGVTEPELKNFVTVMKWEMEKAFRSGVVEATTIRFEGAEMG